MQAQQEVRLLEIDVPLGFSDLWLLAFSYLSCLHQEIFKYLLLRCTFFSCCCKASSCCNFSSLCLAGLAWSFLPCGMESTVVALMISNEAVKVMLLRDEKVADTFKEKVDYLQRYLVEEGETDAARFMMIIRGMLDHRVPADKDELNGVYKMALEKVWNIVEDSGWILKLEKEETVEEMNLHIQSQIILLEVLILLVPREREEKIIGYHVTEFRISCQTHDLVEDSVFLRLFDLSFGGEVVVWYFSLLDDYITLSQDLVQKFISSLVIDGSQNSANCLSVTIRPSLSIQGLSSFVRYESASDESIFLESRPLSLNSIRTSPEVLAVSPTILCEELRMSGHKFITLGSRSISLNSIRTSPDMPKEAMQAT
eukprot:Gb_06260 [translate_table: standard]